MPTRLPYGISFIKPGARSGDYQLVAGDTTPDVSLGTVFFTASSGVTITNFDGGERGKVIIIISNSASVTTIQNSAGGINVNALVTTISSGYLTYSSSGNYVMGAKDAIQFVHNGSDWTQVSASIRV